MNTNLNELVTGRGKSHVMVYESKLISFYIVFIYYYIYYIIINLF